MKTMRHLTLTMVFFAVAMFTMNFALADMNAQGIVNQFNNTPDGQRTLFNYSMDDYGVRLTQVNGINHVDTSAYKQGVFGDSNSFRTLCIQPKVGVNNPMSMVLNYANNTSTSSTGQSLSVGAAYLYSQYAAGTLQGYNHYPLSASYGYLLSAVHGLIGLNPVDWDNTFMKLLLRINSDEDYWTQTYDPNKYYDDIGDYSVFIINCYDANGNGGYQNFLYVAKASNSSDTPEPAMVFFGDWEVSV